MAHCSDMNFPQHILSWSALHSEIVVHVIWCNLPMRWRKHDRGHRLPWVALHLCSVGRTAGGWGYHDGNDNQGAFRIIPQPCLGCSLCRDDISFLSAQLLHLGSDGWCVTSAALAGMTAAGATMMAMTAKVPAWRMMRTQALAWLQRVLRISTPTAAWGEIRARSALYTFNSSMDVIVCAQPCSVPCGEQVIGSTLPCCKHQQAARYLAFHVQAQLNSATKPVFSRRRRESSSLHHLPLGSCISTTQAPHCCSSTEALVHGTMQAPCAAKPARSRRRPTSSNKRLRREFQARKSLAGEAPQPCSRSPADLANQQPYACPLTCATPAMCCHFGRDRCHPAIIASANRTAF